MSPSVVPTVLLIAALVLPAIKNSFVKDLTAKGLGCLGYGGTAFLYWIGTAIPIVALLWLIWPKLMLGTSTPISDGIDADAVKREYSGFFRFGAGGLLLIYVFVLFGTLR